MKYKLLPIEKRVTLFKDKDVKYPFDNNAKPSLSLKLPGTYGHTEYIDPFPCYHHDRDLVIAEAKKAEAAFPLGSPPHYFILPFDTTSYTNGWASYERVWNYGGKDINLLVPWIGLSGKRIVLHPAMTKYLVAHEYGHCVQYWIEYRTGIKQKSPSSFEREYANIRGITCNRDYGARKWHRNIREIIVNDFRIIMTGAEVDFWPHEVDHPLNCKAIQKHWKKLKKKYSYKKGDPIAYKNSDM
jgi:hypothetical protein